MINQGKHEGLLKTSMQLRSIRAAEPVYSIYGQLIFNWQWKTLEIVGKRYVTLANRTTGNKYRAVSAFALSKMLGE